MFIYVFSLACLSIVFVSVACVLLTLFYVMSTSVANLLIRFGGVPIDVVRSIVIVLWHILWHVY